MGFSKIFLLVTFTMVFVKDTTQFLVANCVWDDALTGAPLGDLRGFVLSDADACALFCSKPGGAVISASSEPQKNPGSSAAALCDRCCKSDQPASKPGELLVSILHTLIKAFGPSKKLPSSTAVTDTEGTSGTTKPSQDLTAKPESTKPDFTDDNDGPIFDPGDEGQTVNLNHEKAAFVDRTFDHAPSTAGFREHRAYPEARIFEITGRDDGPSFSDGFDHATDRGPGWPHTGEQFPVKSGGIR